MFVRKIFLILTLALLATAARAQSHTEHISPGDRPLIKMKHLNRTFVGVSETCGTFHTDPSARRRSSTTTKRSFRCAACTRASTA